MLLHLFVGSIALSIVYLILAMLTIFFILFISNKTQEITLKVIVSCIIAMIVQAYLWLLWTSFCVFSVKYYIDSPLVSPFWLYYLFGFLAATFLLTLLDEGMTNLKIRRSINLIEKVQLIVFGANIWFFVKVSG